MCDRMAIERCQNSSYYSAQDFSSYLILHQVQGSDHHRRKRHLSFASLTNINCMPKIFALNQKPYTNNSQPISIIHSDIRLCSTIFCSFTLENFTPDELYETNTLYYTRSRMINNNDVHRISNSEMKPAS